MAISPQQPGLGAMLRSMQDPERWRRFLQDLQLSGVRIDPSQSGGFNPRNIAGTNIPSQHAFGRAFDANWTANPRRDSALTWQDEYYPSETDIEPSMRVPPQVAREVASRHGMTWGGDWARADPMHFEFGRGGPTPLANRSIVAHAGNPPPGQVTGAGAFASPVPLAPPPPPPMPYGWESPALNDVAPPNPWQTTVTAAAPPESAGKAGTGGGDFGTTFGNALANAIPEIEPRVNPTAQGLLSGLPPPMAPPRPSWVANPFQRPSPRMARFGGQYGS
jgi:hypothetical protein